MITASTELQGRALNVPNAVLFRAWDFHAPRRPMLSTGESTSVSLRRGVSRDSPGLPPLSRRPDQPDGERGRRRTGSGGDIEPDAAGERAEPVRPAVLYGGTSSYGRFHPSWGLRGIGAGNARTCGVASRHAPGQAQQQESRTELCSLTRRS